MSKIEVVDYRPEWQSYFESLKQHLMDNIHVKDIKIEHIGSTSVIGLAAKPIIDLVIIFNDLSEFEELKTDLERIHYIHVGDQGITGREVFKSAFPTEFPTHHLYAASKDAPALKNHLTLRDHLRKHPDDVKAYGNLKKRLAISYPNDIDSYIEGKTDFIVSILRQYDSDNEYIDTIIAQNKKS